MPDHIAIGNPGAPGLVEQPPQCDSVSCLDLWLEWMEEVRALDQLALLDAEVRHARPATPAEWSAFWSAEFPRSHHG